MNAEIAKLMNQAGTGFMPSLSGVINEYAKKGYVENLVPHFDHFECRDGAVKLYLNEIHIDDMMRFENTSDPDDQAILYAISSGPNDLKGLYVDSYGLYHDDLAPEIIRFLRVVGKKAPKLQV